ncbi:MAG: FadR family transcriptional regulator [Devosia nanyangense]|uniref:FadR family transcriptional regulator n=1 Tax=Devosia nanyangense TaxID=1228055 RepID=A0A933L1A1_9HYPH|nr:FadR family transcriptional regulator [Devosia nanyangense]
MEQLKSIRLYEQIAGAIRARIVSGELTKGDRLPTEREVAVGYGVSRNVVREAIRALAKDGLVEVRQGSGTYVADATTRALGDSIELALTFSGVTRDLGQLVEIRQIIEPSVAGLAALRATSDDIAALRREVAAMDDAFADVDGFIAADHRFHVAIAKASQNQFLPMILYTVVDVLNEQRKRLFFVTHSAKIAQSFHHKILAAIERRDATAATEAMRGHLGQVSRDLEQLPTKQISGRDGSPDQENPGALRNGAGADPIAPIKRRKRNGTSI